MSPAWTALRDGPGSELVLACDFATAGRRIATFADLVALTGDGPTVWESAPAPPAGSPDGDAQVARWAEAVRASGRPVRAVLGFCTGAVYAAALAAEISRSQPTRLILLDPEPGDARPMLAFHREVVARFAALAPPGAADTLAAAEAAATEDDLTTLAERLVALCAEVVEPACANAGLGAARTADYLDVAASYLHWLAGAGSLRPRPSWTTASAINSSTPGSGLLGFSPAERAGLVADAVHLDVSHEDLMRTPEAARTTARLVREKEPT
ncbi:hypothetical protein GCM10027271_01980 [Saccharopolyspora gloriosae]|uniref:Thioesterase domain-containing protein n=1 Tax=Saccharopolyspora gloriosae TaxID=455344 RepID=A0A840NKI1_9PSEU|nr:hypothetical protein [Saccharopolyspora gloriosae]MBB5070535.1 hypothetical protein [Saccharopolyspora gloriosae]